MQILIGQGNPGPKYAGNRHNLGFMLIDAIAREYRFPVWRSKFSSEISEGEIGGYKVALLKPETFYNETGRAAQVAARFYKLDPSDITVFHDEIDLAPGRVRVKRGGGHSGNNGIRSMIAHVGPEIRRVRLGVGHPGDKDLVMPYVLADFPKSEEAMRDTLVEVCAKALPILLAGEDDRFQSEVMRLAPAPKHDPKQARS